MKLFSSPRPFTRLQPATTAAFQFQGGFWGPRQLQLRQSILPHQFLKIIETGRLENFYHAAGKSDTPFKGYFFNDSDIYKWLEAAAYTHSFDPGEDLSKAMDVAITAIEDAQQEDGYLNTYFMFERANKRWTNLQDLHELYCAGHLFEAAVAHSLATGSDRLISVARRLADHIDAQFGPQGRPGTPGHPEIELALVKLAEHTGEIKYLQLAQSFVDQRGHGLIGGKPYHQDHQPIRQMEKLTGHAVRALYLCSGATDLFQRSGEAALGTNLEQLWQNMVQSQVYISGGVGSRYEGEAFGEPYELPNSRAYTETCAAIASLMWNKRMLQNAGTACYADWLEWTLYNAVLPGISLDGKAYFYVNPLENDGSHRRQEWFECACCPPNIARVLASLAEYFFSVSQEKDAYGQSQPGLWIHTYAQGELSLPLRTEQKALLQITTDYPWQGEIEIEITHLDQPAEFSIFLRIPGWCLDRPGISINGSSFEVGGGPSSYVQLTRRWQCGDTISLVLPIHTRLIESHPYVMENTRRAAISRGPLLFCLENADHPGVDLKQAAISPQSAISHSFQTQLLNGVMVLETTGEIEEISPQWQGNLYLPYQNNTPQIKTENLKAIPYFAWGNRTAGGMQTWLKVR